MLSLIELYAHSKQWEKDALERMRTLKDVSLEPDMAQLWQRNQIEALYYFFVEENCAKAKNCFYVCSRIDEFRIKKYDARILDTSVSTLLYTVLSDNLSLMRRFAELGHSQYVWMVEHGHSTLLYAIQQVIKEDWERLQWSLDIMANKNQKLNKVLLPDRKFFEGMLAKDKAMIAEAIEELLKDHKKRNKHMGIAQDYISIPALGYAKLAWLKGMEIEIDKPLIPKALLPYKPLEKYEDKYDFLKEI